MTRSEAQPRPCPSCGGTMRRPVTRYSHPDWPMVQCDACNLVYLQFAPDYAALVEDLAWEKTHAKEAQRRKKHWLYRLDYATRFRLRFGNAMDRRFVLHGATPGSRVLDVGCGGSCRIPDGMVPFGIEISKGLAGRSGPVFRSRGGDVVNAPALEGLDSFPDNFFDRAILRSYLEHELQPRAVLEKLYRKMRAGGSAAVKVPDYGCIGRHVMGPKWCGFRYPDHQNYFTRRTLTDLARTAGFTCRFTNICPGMNDNLYAILQKPGEAEPSGSAPADGQRRPATAA